MKMEKSYSHTDWLSILLIIAVCIINSLFSCDMFSYDSLKYIVSEYLLSTKYFQIIIFYHGKESSKPTWFDT